MKSTRSTSLPEKVVVSFTSSSLIALSAGVAANTLIGSKVQSMQITRSMESSFFFIFDPP